MADQFAERSNMRLMEIADTLLRRTRRLRFRDPVAFVYNPLSYALAPYRRYVERFGRGRREVIFLGMNPGPWGMAQTGIPFGEVNIVRDWLGVEAPVGRPKREHPKRRIRGFDCPRSEISGLRFWGWARHAFETPERFFRRFFVMNYCPLCFLEASGRNRTPDKLPRADRESLFAACDEALRATVQTMKPRLVIGVGQFAETRARVALDGLDAKVKRILHPSPASPLANRNWAGRVVSQLAACGVKEGE